MPNESGLPTSFPGSLSSASLGCWKKDPGCGWSCDHPESGWQKNLLDRRGGKVLCLLMWETLWVSNHDHLAVAKNYSFYRGSKPNLPMKDAARFLPFLKYRRLPFTKKFGSRMEQKQVPNRSETSSGSVFWIFVFGGNLFSSLCGFLTVKSISVMRSISRVFWFTGLFCWHQAAYCLYQVYVSLYLDRCWMTVPWGSQELYFATWLIKHRFI